MSFTTSDLVASILRRCFAPSGQTTFTTAEILAISDELMLTDIVPDIMSVREEFFVFYEDEAIAANQLLYNIPARAVGMLLREIWLVDDDGETIDPNFPRIEPEQVKSLTPGTPEGFMLRNNSLMLVPPALTATKTLRKWFLLRPGSHVETSDAAVVSAIDTVTNTVTVATIPSSWATGDDFDIVRQDGGQEPLAIDQTSTLVTGSTITLPSLPDTLRVGDYLSRAGETALPFLPAEYRIVLAQGVASEILALTNQPGADAAKKRYTELRQMSRKLITPRVQGEDRVIQAPNWF